MILSKRVFLSAIAVCSLLNFPLLSYSQTTFHQKKALVGVKLATICGKELPNFFAPVTLEASNEAPSTKYPVLLFTMENGLPVLYWKRANDGIDSFARLGAHTFTPIAYTTEPLFVVSCNTGKDTTEAPKPNNQATTPTDAEKLQLTVTANINGKAAPATVVATSNPALDLAVKNKYFHLPVPEDESYDSITIDAVTANTITYVYFYPPTPGNPGSIQVKNVSSKDANTKTPVSGKGIAAEALPANGAAPADPKGADTSSSAPIAWAIVERHKVVHFSIGGGFVGFHGQSHTFSAITVPTVISTQTCAGTLTTMQPGATQASGSTSTTTAGYAYNPCSPLLPVLTLPTGVFISSYGSNMTTATTAGTASYAFGTQGQPWSVDALAGLTVYPFGHDTYPPSIGRGFSIKYGFEHPSNSVGLFLGASVNNFGNFTGGLAYEVFPGVQVMAGSTFWSKTSLAPNIKACSGYGTSAPYTVAPTSTEDNVTVTYTQATTGMSPTPSNNTITDAKTTITTSATSGCANGDTATMISGTTVPTQSAYKPAFSFGIIFNSNLSKAFSSIFK
jgi:hypothetical protein